MMMKQWTTSIFFLSFIGLLRIPLMSSAPPGDPSSAPPSSVSTSKPTFLSSLQATSDNFTNPHSSCIFPPRNLFLPQSPYKTLCPNISDLENGKDGIMQISDFNNSICLAIRYASAKLCTNDAISTIQNTSAIPLTTDALINSNANSTIEAFCVEFEKVMHLRSVDSTKEIDDFFKSFFGVTQADDKNQCSEMCRGTKTSTNINVLCALANVGFEMIQIQSLNSSESAPAIEGKKIEPVTGKSLTKETKVEDSPGVGTESKPRASGTKDPQEDRKKPVSIPENPVDDSKSTDSQPPIPSPSDTDIKSENKNNPENAQSSQVISSKPLEKEKILVDKQSSVSPTSLSSDSPKIQQNADVKPPVMETNPNPNTGSTNGKVGDFEDTDIGGGGGQPDLDAESSENNLPMPELDNNPMSGKSGDDQVKGKTVFDKSSSGDSDSSGQQRQDNSAQKSVADPNILYMGDPEDESTGYFGYFVTFIGLCGLAFIMFHNKKRIIALCIEGRQKPAGRRRSRSGSAAYRKLENNFE